MAKCFNTTGDCKPKLHYMVDIESRLIEIEKLIDKGSYFTINRARQYGKTTTLRALTVFLEPNYIVLSLDFQGFSAYNFQSEERFVTTFIKEILRADIVMPDEIGEKLKRLSREEHRDLYELFVYLSEWCEKAAKPMVLIIDEVDSASNNQIFLDFLAQLRRYYLNRDITGTFQSVILAGVYDVKNIKMKLHPNEPSKTNSPWNIAADFEVDMNFSAKDIEGMLYQYESEHHTTMDSKKIAQLLYNYTSGYPFLVSRLCKLIDEIVSKRLFSKRLAWTEEGILQAVNLLLNETNTLFSSLINKLQEYEEIRKLISLLLFKGQQVTYTATNEAIEVASMFGFIKEENMLVTISNRIFETVLYNYLLSKEFLQNELYVLSLQERNQFVKDGKLDMELVLERFVYSFTDIYGNNKEKFIEDEGRKYFLLFLKPIINGVGNYYIEAQTRDMKRTDIIIDYLGKRYIVEMKIWHGEEYNMRGEKQLLEYLDYYRLQEGYMLSFNFNQKKQSGLHYVEVDGRRLVEAVV